MGVMAVCMCLHTCGQTPRLGSLRARLEVRKGGTGALQRLQLTMSHLLYFSLRNELLLHLKTYNLYYEGQNLQLRHREVRSLWGRRVGQPSLSPCLQGLRVPASPVPLGVASHLGC